MLEAKAFLRGTSTGIAGGFPNQQKDHSQKAVVFHFSELLSRKMDNKGYTQQSSNHIRHRLSHLDA